MTTAVFALGPAAASDVRQPSTAAIILAPLATVLLTAALRLPTRSETLEPIIGVLASGIVELIAQIALWLAIAWLIKRSFSLAVLRYSAQRRRAAGLRVFEGGAKLLIDLFGVALCLSALVGIVGIVLDQPIGDLLATSGLFAAIIGLATEGVHEDPAPIELIDECNDRGVVYSLSIWVKDYPDQFRAKIRPEPVREPSTAGNETICPTAGECSAEGAEGAGVERVLGPPTTTATSLDATNDEIGDYSVLVYDDEALRPRITIESGHITAIELDLTGISVARLQAHTRHSAIPIALARTDLRIGMTPNKAAGLLGPLEYTPTTASFKGRPVFYATYSTHDGDRLASLTFTDGVLTAFSIWHRPVFTCC